MSLSSDARERLGFAITSQSAANEICDAIDNAILSSASTSFHLGGSAPTNPQAFFAVQPPANVGVTANQSYYQSTIAPGGAVTIPAGTAAIVATLNVEEPNITATGTVTAAATVRIAGAPTEGGVNYALWVDADTTRLDGDLNFSTALDIVVQANTAAALEVYDGTTKLLAVDTRNTIADVSNVKLTGAPTTIASATAAHINATLNIAAKTITYTGTATVTSSFGAQLYIAAPTFTDASAGTITKASTLHVAAVAAAGGSLTITASYMISTGVADCFLTNAGVWTDTACYARGKEMIVTASAGAIDSILGGLTPKTWLYLADVHGDDAGTNRVGIIYDDLPPELRAPGQEGVSPGVLASFALAALKTLWDRNRDLETRLAKLER